MSWDRETTYRTTCHSARLKVTRLVIAKEAMSP
jgi:hypothetical protein